MGNDYKYITIEIGEVKYAIPIEYAGYIVSTERKFIQCTPPNMPAFVKQILIVEGEQALIVDLDELNGVTSPTETHPLILLLDYNDTTIGILADRVYLPSVQSDARIEVNPTVDQKFVKMGGENYLLFNVSELYNTVLG